MNKLEVMTESVLLSDPKTMEMAKAEATAFYATHPLWGMDADDVIVLVQVALWNAEWAILAVPEGSRIEAIRTVISFALNEAKDESKANRSRLQPFPIGKAYMAGKDVTAAYLDMVEEEKSAYEVLEEKRELLAHLEIAISLMGEYAQYCRDYIDLESWDKVAEMHGIPASTFRRRKLPRMARRGRVIWAKIW